jgi:hypothetical protein|tara:strand:+ start:694 stop:975 length:282 start_codon:yes stop_codon:yes gene_type:complete
MVDITKQTLLKTLEAVTGKREDDYGDKLKNHQNIADLWSIYLKRKITAHDVAICMALLKIARIMHSHHEDAYIDLAGYAAIAREIDIEGKLKK